MTRMDTMIHATKYPAITPRKTVGEGAATNNELTTTESLCISLFKIKSTLMKFISV